LAVAGGAAVAAAGGAALAAVGRVALTAGVATALASARCRALVPCARTCERFLQEGSKRSLPKHVSKTILAEALVAMQSWYCTRRRAAATLKAGRQRSCGCLHVLCLSLPKAEETFTNLSQLNHQAGGNIRISLPAESSSRRKHSHISPC
jgi:hypothetical protein